MEFQVIYKQIISMENQKKYDQALYNICQLILKRKYRRAIYIADHILSQGFSSHELLTLKSYAISKNQGPQKAIESIQYQEGPLISMAKSQYFQSLHNWQQAQKSLSTLSVQNKQSPIETLLDSNAVLMTGETKQIEMVNSEKVIFVAQHKQSQCIAKINEITLLYTSLKAKKEGSEFEDEEQYKKQCQNLVQKYENIMRQYRPKKQVLLALQQYIRFLREIQINRE